MSGKRKLKRRRKIKGFRLTNKTITILSVIGVLIVLFGIYEIILVPKIDLKGKKLVVLNYKDKYIEKGFNAHYFGKNISDDVEISGKVNPKKLGTYTITYKVKEGLFSKRVIRIVEVKDTEKPKLDVSDEDLYVCPGDKAKIKKVKATDNYDGDLTKKVKATISNDKLTYRVMDSSGNAREVVKNILYEDKEKPKITLNGDNTIYLFIGDKYQEYGAQVSDNCDSKLEKELKIDSKVNTAKAGEYEVTYKVSDKAGNINKVVRKVVVRENANGVVYLTFDDGPNEGTTDVILDVLKEKNVKATFFVTSKGPDSLIKREADEGHTVALHTSSHDYANLYSSDEAFFNDLNAVSERVKRITGKESKIIRFPGGSSNTISRRYSQGIMTRLTQKVLEKGYKYYDWNISSGDAGNTTDPNQVYLNVVNNLSRDRANMVLMHDIKPYTRDAIGRIIDYCKANGYRMEKITMSTEMVRQRVNN